MIITFVDSLLPSHDDIDDVNASVPNKLISGIDDISILYTFYSRISSKGCTSNIFKRY